MILSESQREEFEKIVRPAIRFLNNNCHPHVRIAITPTNAVLTEDVCSTGQILDYVKD